MNLYTIIIPCHNNCESAEKLANKFNNVIIGHNGCNRVDAFTWSNKAKTINEIAKKITSDYIIIMDADNNPSEFSILAFEKEMKKGTVFGTALCLTKTQKNDIIGASTNSEFNGALWFIKTEILKKYVIPENILVEDTAYHEFLKKNNIESKIVMDAICFIDIDKDLVRSARRGIRYHLGSLQLIRLGIYRYTIPVLLSPCLVIGYILYSIWDLGLFSNSFATTTVSSHIFVLLLFLDIILVTLGTIGITRFSKFISRHEYLTILFGSIFYIIIAPFVAIYFYIRKKSIW